MSNVARIINEGPLGFSALAKKFKSSRRDGNLTPQAIWRWHRRGIKTKDGRHVFLEAVCLAGRYLTSLQAIERFIEAQQPQAADSQPLPIRTPTARQRASQRADRELADLGI